ncbi:MAG: head-tail adaptor protein [Planctomycetota bacterium]
MTKLARKLRSEVKIQSATKTPNAQGGYDRGYTTIRRAFAGIKELSAIEILNSKNAGSGATARITMRWDPDINPELFLLTVDENHPPRRFKVLSVLPVNRYEYIEITAEEIEIEE